MSDLNYKLAVIDEAAAVMRQKVIEKEPRASWREKPMALAEVERWLRQEIEELIAAPLGQEMREAADVANMAAIYADIARRTRAARRDPRP